MTDKNYPSGQPTVQALSRSDSRGKILQWHPGFCAALQIELKEEAEFLEFYPEYELSKKPMRIDTLIVKKIEDRPVKKNIGRIFRKYNLIEYKSPEDYLSINDFYKVYGYACFYQSDTEKIHEIRMSEITISFVCSHYPREMLRSLREERGIEAEKTADGIYCLKNDVIPIQMILSHGPDHKGKPKDDGGGEEDVRCIKGTICGGIEERCGEGSTKGSKESKKRNGGGSREGGTEGGKAIICLDWETAARGQDRRYQEGERG